MRRDFELLYNLISMIFMTILWGGGYYYFYGIDGENRGVERCSCSDKDI